MALSRAEALPSTLEGVSSLMVGDKPGTIDSALISPADGTALTGDFQRDGVYQAPAAMLRKAAANFCMRSKALVRWSIASTN